MIDGKKKEEEDIKKTEEIGNMKISDIKLKIVKDKCTEYSVDESKVCERFGIDSLENMTEKMFASALKIFDKTEKK